MLDLLVRLETVLPLKTNYVMLVFKSGSEGHLPMESDADGSLKRLQRYDSMPQGQGDVQCRRNPAKAAMARLRCWSSMAPTSIFWALVSLTFTAGPRSTRSSVNWSPLER